MEVREASAGYGIKPRYKQTEVGLIPDDWEVKPLGRLLRRPPAYGINASAVAYDSRLPTYLRITDITENGRFSEEGKASVAHSFATDYFLENGDLAFARTGASVGKSYRYRSSDGPLVFAGFLIRLSPDPEQLTPVLLSYFSQSRPYWNWVTVNSMRSGQPGINGREYSSLPIPVPPTKAEQEAIAEALSDADALIESLEQLLAKKRHVKQGAMQQLLTGIKRLPGFTGSTELITDQFGTRPKNWKMIPLKNLVDGSRGIRYGIVQPGTFDPNGRYMIRGQDYSESKGWAESSEVFRVSDTIEYRYRNARVQQGDLIMTIVGYCGHVEMVPNWLDGANLTQTTARIAIQSDKAVPSFCKYILQGPVGKNQVAAFIKGAAQPGLNCGDVEKFLLPLPPLEEQSAIAAVLSDMDAEIATLESKLGKARSLKQGMMQVLLTGRIRLGEHSKAANSIGC